MEVVWEILEDLLWEAADNTVDNAFRYFRISDRSKPRSTCSLSTLAMICPVSWDVPFPSSSCPTTKVVMEIHEINVVLSLDPPTPPPSYSAAHRYLVHALKSASIAR